MNRNAIYYLYPIDSKNTSICTVSVSKLLQGCVKKDNNTILNTSSFSICFWRVWQYWLKYIKRNSLLRLFISPKGSEQCALTRLSNCEDKKKVLKHQHEFRSACIFYFVEDLLWNMTYLFVFDNTNLLNILQGLIIIYTNVQGVYTFDIS